MGEARAARLINNRVGNRPANHRYGNATIASYEAPLDKRPSYHQGVTITLPGL